MNNYKIITIKCYLSSILNKKSKNYNKYKKLILNSIKDINIITSLLYDYIKLRCLYNFENYNEQEINFYNRKYINRLNCHLLNTTNKNTFNININDFINNNKFYNNIPNRNRTTEILKEVLDNIITHIKVNIQEHYINHLLKFIKLFINNYDNNKNNKLKFYSFILNMEYNKNKINFNDLSNKLQQFYNKYENIFNVKFDKYKEEKSLYYNIKISPESYFKSMYLINKEFEDYNNKIKELINKTENKEEKYKLNSSIIKLFNILPSKNNYFNNYIPFSPYTLAKLINYNILNKETKKQDDNLVNNMFNKLFNFNKLNIRKNLIFTGHFETDGIGCSLQFYNTKYKITKKKEDNDLKYLNNLKKNELNNLKDKKIIGIDPGKYNILYMSDGYNKLRYTIHQRKYESGILKRKRFIDKIKNKNKEIIEIETYLSSFNSKTNYYNNFKLWLENKYKYFDKLFNFYNNNKFRRLKIEIYQKKIQSEKKLVNNIKNKFGNNLILVFGDWNDEQGYRTGETSTCKGIKKKLNKYYESYLVDEYNTSKLCCKCGNKLEHYKDKFRLLICKDCKTRTQYHYKYYDKNVKCLKEQNITFKSQIFTRDLNSCLNIIKLLEHIINNKKEKILLGYYGRETISMLKNS